MRHVVLRVSSLPYRNGRILSRTVSYRAPTESCLFSTILVEIFALVSDFRILFLPQRFHGIGSLDAECRGVQDAGNYASLKWFKVHGLKSCFMRKKSSRRTVSPLAAIHLPRASAVPGAQLLGRPWRRFPDVFCLVGFTTHKKTKMERPLLA